jgi:DNA modification methylase
MDIETNFGKRKNMSRITFLNEDANSLSIEDSSVDLILTAPPYFGVDTFRYGGDSTQQINHTDNEKKYVENLLNVTNEFYRILKNDGSLIINLNFPITYLYYVEVVEKTKFKYASTFLWDYSEDNMKQEKFFQSHQTWLHFYKGSHFYENPFGVKKHSGSVIRTKFNNLHLEKEQELQKHGFILDAYSMDLAEHFIKTYSPPKSVVADPFGGSGVAAITAYLNDRDGITNDISLEAANLAKKRFEIYVGDSKV